MTDTEALIARLSSEAKTPMRPLSPVYWGTRLVIVLGIYALGAQLFLGFRPDLLVQLTRPGFAAEIALLVALLLSSTVASVLAMYPDACQKLRLMLLPYALFLIVALLIVVQMFVTTDVRMVLPASGAHGLECALCIGSVALVPSAFIFALLRKGASVRQMQAGFLAVLSASAIGCLTLRLAEPNDSMLHLASWHYLPTLLYAVLGAAIAKRLLRW
jgi:hypothetical protein